MTSETPHVMGVVNVTPDSFSDGGRFIDGGQVIDADAALAHALQLAADGADIIDVGGESTRPGADRVTPAEEQRRVLPLVRALAGRDIAVSVDTMNAETAAMAVHEGAVIVNDVSGGLADAGMAAAIASTPAIFVIGHWRTHSATMNAFADYDDVVTEVRDELSKRIDDARAAGISGDRIVLDPGLGFSKNGSHNWELLARLDEMLGLGYPVLVGTSRKRFLGALLPDDAPMTERDLPTAVTSVLAAQAGVWGVRVHDASATRLALDTWRAWQSGRRG